MSTECDNHATAPGAAQLARSAVCIASLSRADEDHVPSGSVPRVARFVAVDGEHGRQAGFNGAIGCGFGLGRHVDGQAVAISEAQHLQILADVELVVGVGVGLQVATGRHDAAHEAAGDAAMFVDKVARLVQPDELARWERCQIRAVLSKGNATFSGCDLAPVESERACVGIAALATEGAG